MKILREIIYFGQVPDEKIISTILKIGGSEKVVKHWLRFIKDDHHKIHRHLDIQAVEKELFGVLKNCMVNYLREDTLAELARLPQLQRYPDLVQEVQRTFDQAARKAGFT
jgi:hypothetical protein